MLMALLPSVSHKLHTCFVKMKTFMCLAPLSVTNHYSSSKLMAHPLNKENERLLEYHTSDQQRCGCLKISCVIGNEKEMQLLLCQLPLG